MAYTRGRCTNFDYCSIAENRRDVEVRVGDDFVCPECGKPLKAPQITATGTSPLLPALIGVGVLVLVGGAVFLGMRMGGSATPAAHLAAPPAAQQAANAPPPSPPPASPTPVPPAASAAAAPSVTAAAPPPAQGPAAPVAVPPPPAENVLARLHGSPVVATALIAPVAAAYLAQVGDTAVTTETHGRDLQVVGMRGGIRETILIAGDGVEAGFRALGAGAADVVMSPRRILPTEQTALTTLGDMTDTRAEHLLAIGAQAVVVNTANQVASLSRDQVRDIFAGIIKDWASLGATSGPIDLYGSPDGAAGAPLGGLSLDKATGMKRLPSDQDVSKAVGDDPRGIGLVDLAAAGGAHLVPIADTGAQPVSPADHAAVVADDYPLSYRLYLYTSPKAADGFAQRFVEFALSPPGQMIAEQHGFVSPTLKHEAPAAPATEAQTLKSFVAGAKRLAIVFRFQPNSTALDEYGEVALNRVTNYLLSLHEGGDHLLLAGFADNQGDPASNIAVSKKRADAVAALFVRRGVTPAGVAGFGAELPVADNSTEAGRERNRRVEVYIKP